MPNEHDISTVEGRARLKELCEKAPEGPWFVSSDEAADCPDHENSGLATVEGSSDWPIARLCEWHAAEFIAAARTALPAAVAQINEDAAYKTAVRILLEGEPGAAQNAVREDYPDLAAMVDANREADKERIAALEREHKTTCEYAVALERERDELQRWYDGTYDAHEKLVGELEEARKALRPLANIPLSHLPTFYTDHSILWELNEKRITVGDVKAARAALNEPAPPAPEPEKYERSRVYINGFKAGLLEAARIVQDLFESTSDDELDNHSPTEWHEILVAHIKMATLKEAAEAGEPAPKGEQG